MIRAPPGVHDLRPRSRSSSFYHDTTYMSVDRAEMDRNMLRRAEARRPVGDRRSFRRCRARALSVGKTLHRIEESTLRQGSRGGRFPRRCRRQFLATSQTTRATSRATGLPCRSMSSCSSSRSRCEAALVRLNVTKRHCVARANA